MERVCALWRCFMHLWRDILPLYLPQPRQHGRGQVQEAMGSELAEFPSGLVSPTVSAFWSAWSSLVAVQGFFAEGETRVYFPSASSNVVLSGLGRCFVQFCRWRRQRDMYIVVVADSCVAEQVHICCTRDRGSRFWSDIAGQPLPSSRGLPRNYT